MNVDNQLIVSQVEILRNLFTIPGHLYQHRNYENIFQACRSVRLSASKIKVGETSNAYLESSVTETESQQETLRRIIQNTRNYGILLHRIRMWMPRRQALLQKLSVCTNDLCKISKLCTIGRMIGCTVESFCTIGGLCYSEDAALNTATLFGLLGFFCTIIDTQITKQRLYNIQEIVKIERELFSKIEEWFNEHEEIKTEMNVIFVFDFTKEVEKYMNEVVAGKKYFDPLILVGLILLVNNTIGKELKNGKEQDYNFIQKFKDFVNTKSLQEYCSCVVLLQTDPNVYDIGKIALEHFKGGNKLPFYQKIRGLDKADQNLLSVPVLGRILLNGLTTVSDAYLLLRREVPRTSELRLREETLQKELEEMRSIVLGNRDAGLNA